MVAWSDCSVQYTWLSSMERLENINGFALGTTVWLSPPSLGMAMMPVPEPVGKS